LWHLSLVRFPLPIFFLAAFLFGGCASSQKKAQLAEEKAKQEDTRATEQRRMLAVENGTVNSMRGAEIFQPDAHKEFDPSRYAANANRAYGTKGASTKSFDSDRQVRLDTFQTRGFWGSKSNSAAQKKFATKDADTHAYLLPDKNPGNKTAATKEAWDAKKTAPTHELSDARRQYLGVESRKLNNKADPKTLSDWRAGGETVVDSDGEIEKVSSLKPLSIDDIRDLLNKSK